MAIRTTVILLLFVIINTKAEDSLLSFSDNQDPNFDFRINLEVSDQNRNDFYQNIFLGAPIGSIQLKSPTWKEKENYLKLRDLVVLYDHLADTYLANSLAKIDEIEPIPSPSIPSLPPKPLRIINTFYQHDTVRNEFELEYWLKELAAINDYSSIEQFSHFIEIEDVVNFTQDVSSLEFLKEKILSLVARTFQEVICFPSKIGLMTKSGSGYLASTSCHGNS